MAGSPFDFMGGLLGDVKVHGLISFTFNLIIPPASIVWERVERNDDDVAKHLLFSTLTTYNETQILNTLLPWCLRFFGKNATSPYIRLVAPNEK